MSGKKYCFIDFEFFDSKEKHPTLVSCSLTTTKDENLQEGISYWLHDDLVERNKLRGHINILIREGYIFVAWAVTAEARCFLALGIDPIKCKFYDLFLEYRCLTNHNHKLMYGSQLIDGRVKKTKPPMNKWDMTEQDKMKFNFSKPQHNLAAGTFKLLGKQIDTDFKDHTRDIIISGDYALIEENKADILAYNESDIAYLPLLLEAEKKEYIRLLRKGPLLKTLKEEMLLRGEYAARTAVMESEGYPIGLEETKAFSRSVPSILWEIQNEINELFPDIKPFTKKKDRTFSWSHVRTREWIKTLPFKHWLKTDTKMDSLSLDAFKKYFDFKHDYPKDNLGAQMVRYLTLKQNLNGFSPTSKNSFWDSVGSDGRVRPYFGIYGAQSARSQPKATGFLFLKSAWMRSLCVPPKGKAVCGIDFKSQEFLLAALLSGDRNMLQAYQSGDPYLHLAKLAGAVPMDGERKDHEEIRDMFKSTTLGISYGMTKYGLSNKLTADLGRKVDEDEAQRLVDKFNKAYRTYYRWSMNLAAQYKRDKHMKLPCGWYMWGDNRNARSVANVPLQGFGSSIMRRAVGLAQDRGLKVILTLHDAIYIECNSDKYDSAVSSLAECMDEAFRYFFDADIKPLASVGLDGALWSGDFPREEKILTFGKAVLKRQQVYIDGRSKREYEQFKRYFVPETYNEDEI